jgi:hypothetical protein
MTGSSSGNRAQSYTMTGSTNAVFAALIAVALAPGSGTDACKKAVERYNAVKAEVELALQDYEQCVANSRGRNSCAVEFDEVNSVQDRFESAVVDYQEACR